MTSARVRLGAFALVLLGAFGTAYAAGEQLPGHSHGSVGHTHSNTLVPAATNVDGYQLMLESRQGIGKAFAFHIDAPDGSRVTEFADNHGSKLHTVLVHPDLSGFQHIHPEIAADGSFVVPVTQPGKWHLVFDTWPAGAANSIALATDVDDQASVDTVPLPAADDSPTLDGLTITRDGLQFTVTRADGAPVEGLEPYLGQPAHLIALRQGDLAYTHLHPVTGSTPTTMPGMPDMTVPADDLPGTLTFAGTISQPGTYRLFLQFGYRGGVLTVPYTVVVR